MSDLVEFLRARLDEDEAVARCGAAELGGTWTADQVSSTEGAAAHIARWDPARVLADVEAKRRILDRYEDAVSRQTEPDYWRVDAIEQAREYQDWVLPYLAQPHADHPDFDPAWRLS